MRSVSTAARARAAVLVLALVTPGLGGFEECNDGDTVIVTGTLTPDAVSAETKQEVSVSIGAGTPPVVAAKACAGQTPGDPNACPGVGTPFQLLVLDPDLTQHFTSQGLQSGGSGGFYQHLYLTYLATVYFPSPVIFDAIYHNFLFTSVANSRMRVTVSALNLGGNPAVVNCFAHMSLAGGPALDLPVNETTEVVIPGPPGAIQAVTTAGCEGNVLEPEGPVDTPTAFHLTVEWERISEVCTSDAQCADPTPFCADGVCRSGAEGQRCVNLFDCAAGLLCSALTFRCLDGSAFDACQIDADCPGSHACVNGSCSDGNVFDSCFEDTDCSSEAPIQPSEFCVSQSPFIGTCSAGIALDACLDNADCQSGGCSGGVCD